MNDIKAIETKYHGYRFRSRLEARWAVFLDELGIKWEYEKEGYVIDGVPYLPDFFLSDWKVFLEVKGQRAPDKYVDMLRSFARKLGCAVVIWQGIPRGSMGNDNDYFGKIFLVDSTDSGSGESEWVCQFVDFKKDGIGLMIDTDDDPSDSYLQPDYSSFSFVVDHYKNRTDYSWDKIYSAAEHASSARFEFGEHGATR